MKITTVFTGNFSTPPLPPSVQDLDNFKANAKNSLLYWGTSKTEDERLTTELNEFIPQINALATEVQESAVMAENARAVVVATIGSDYLPNGWNENDSFAGKMIIHNGVVWAGLAPDIGNPPTQSERWLFVSAIKTKVMVNTDYTASAGDNLYIDATLSAITITLPSPMDGIELYFVDIMGKFEENIPLLVAVGGATIWLIDDGFELEKKFFSGKIKCYEIAENIFDWRIE